MRYCFFSKKWIEPDRTNNNWLRFHDYLLMQGWILSDFHRNIINFDRIWQEFSKDLEEKEIKTTPYFMIMPLLPVNLAIH